MKKRKKIKNNKITMDKLAQMTAKGFLELGKKVDGLEEKIGGLEVKVDGLEEKIGGLEVKVDGLEVRVNSGVDKMLTMADAMANEFSHWKQENAFSLGIQQRQQEQLDSHEKRINELEVRS